MDQHPEIILRKKAEHYGYCMECGLYSSLFTVDYINLLCPDCFREHKYPEWEKKASEAQEEMRQIRLKNAFVEECRKRHLKGHAPINLRN